jgi:hypothetical protein
MRRIRLDLMTKAELSIHEAIFEIEKLGADERLTNAQTLLSQAKNLVSDYTDDQLSSLESTPDVPPGQTPPGGK